MMKKKKKNEKKEAGPPVATWILLWEEKLQEYQSHNSWSMAFITTSPIVTLTQPLRPPCIHIGRNCIALARIGAFGSTTGRIMERLLLK
ncbi:hypothetical protein LINPERHAP2_LOCUS4483 [Linum perenne]